MRRYRKYWYVFVIVFIGILLLTGIAVARTTMQKQSTAPNQATATATATATEAPTYPPTPSQQGRKAWASGNPTTVWSNPRGTGNPYAHLDAGFALTLTGQIVTNSAATWYQVTWQNYVKSARGWVQQGDLSFTAPAGSPPQMADLAALSPQLATDTQAQGGNVGVSIYAPNLNRYYGANDGQGFEMASTFKVPILLALLRQDEANNQPISASDQSLASAMIEASDNDAATTLYQEIDYNNGVNRLMASLGIGGLTVNTASFGYSTVTPSAMTQLLTALNAGSFLNAADRQYALSLMSNVDSDEQFGIGTTAPQGAQYAMKDGWIQDDDGSWVDASVGIVTINGHTAIIAVYTQKSASEDAGWKVVNTLCGDIMTTMTTG